ncbi:Concanavalin A-like lectin/glucanase, subgroup [Cynara cardunculus var. scolymus]|uniref:Concanavalin A-like lectin/glucanase, subgroup n=1 Tax=Cynara cardunculus var. scolymus TaxID=59895 RepID=A0A103XBY5_CYNCS|nr:Concanavalin A-like lectin/glucanase, subgroup [Cynara cardunculus var. scolymus]
MMRLATNGRSRWWVVGLLALLLTVMAEPVTSQKIDRNNTMIRWYCSFYQVMNGPFFLRNLNTTFSSLRKQLSETNKYHAVAKTLINGESVYGLALCREYLSTAACLACFDTGVAYMKVCGLGNGAHIFYDDCELRYENNDFYDEAIIKTSVGICGNTTSSHPKELQKTARGLFSDLQIATPKTSNFFVASARQLTGSNVTVYAIAQCSRNLSQSVCVDCLKIRHRSLDGCLPNTFGRAIDSGCFMRYSETPFFGVNQTTDIAPFLKNGSSSNLRSIIGGVVGAIGFLLFILAFLFWHRRSRKPYNHGQGKSTGATEMLQRPTAYTYKDLKIATNNFHEENIIGRGSGEVYKGVLKDGNTVAIKKIAIASKRGKAYMDGEIKIISNVHHRYLIRILGYCSKGSHLYLVLEYMENGSLDKYLYGDKRSSLNWKQRFDIIFGTARGLAYLHEQYHVTIIHRDIKSSNILLDTEFQPKVADFGLVKLLPEDKTHLSTKVMGTLYNGYIAPEYAINGHLSEKVDTYSFGVVILEIISGKWCNNKIENEPISLNFVENARSLYENDMHLHLIDATLDPSEYATEDAKKVIEIALMCTQPTTSARPSMSEVVTLLSERLLDERLLMRSTINDHALRIQVDTSKTTSTYETSSYMNPQETS